jgi:tetratricopeptide (TPR) repeat protein
VSDDIRRWSDELARDPSSMIFLKLGEALRRQGQADLARKVALRGLERRPHNADAHDLLARISVDRGEMQSAFDEWDMVLRLAPAHAGALKGLGFVCFQEGRLEEAERYLAQAVEADEEDMSIASGLAYVRQKLKRMHELSARGDAGESGGGHYVDATPARSGRDPAADAAVPAPPAAPTAPTGDASDPRALFAAELGDGGHAALLLDGSGLVLAGRYLIADPSREDGVHDIAQEIGAELSGVSDEARRAMRHLGLGDWSAIVFETEAATVAMAAAGGQGDGLVLIASERAAPLGLVRRLLDRVSARAAAWLAGEGGGA